MINFDYLTLVAFWHENIDFLIGSRLQKIQQPTRKDFIFAFRNLSESRKMYVNINPSYFHLCFAAEENLIRRDIHFPKQPPMFCMLLRKYLESARVMDVRVPFYERILEIDFKSSNEFDENVNLTLAIEMMGKYSNIILYNSDTKIILGCAHNVGAEKSREREVMGTLPYIYPPRQEYKKDILRYTGEIDYTRLNQDFLGISKSFEELVKDIPLEKIKDYVEVSNVTPAISGDKYSIYSELLKEPVLQDSVSSMIDNYYSKVQEKVLFNQLYLKLKNITGAQLKKAAGTLKKINYQIAKKDRGEEYKKYGDLILANLYAGNDYTKSITVKDWDSGKDIVIQLDATKTLKENSQRYYKLYAKSKDSRGKLEELQRDLDAEKLYLEQLKYTIENADSLQVLQEIESEIIPETKDKKIKNTEIETIDINGFRVYIGKNNRQNDEIVSKISHGEDYWFHVQNAPGSHVLLKVPDSNEPDEKTIYECCKLAKKYSSASESAKAGVIYTKRKFLKKPPGANLGYVLYKNEKEIIVGIKSF